MSLRFTAGAAILALSLAACQQSDTNDETAVVDAEASTETSKTTPSDVSIESTNEIASYVIGYQGGSQFFQNGYEIDREAFLAGLNDAMADRDVRLSEDIVVNDVMREFSAQSQERVRERKEAEIAAIKAQAPINLEKSLAFLEENKSKEGITVTDSGLQYRILAEGEGEKPSIDDVVKVNYRGTLMDGTEFDSSYSRGRPSTFEVGGVINGWTEALLQMPVGSEWELFIPPNIAYGEFGPPDIGPNQALIFTVELIEILPRPPQPE